MALRPIDSAANETSQQRDMREYDRIMGEDNLAAYAWPSEEWSLVAVRRILTLHGREPHETSGHRKYCSCFVGLRHIVEKDRGAASVMHQVLTAYETVLPPTQPAGKFPPLYLIKGLIFAALEARLRGIDVLGQDEYLDKLRTFGNLESLEKEANAWLKQQRTTEEGNPTRTKDDVTEFFLRLLGLADDPLWPDKEDDGVAVSEGARRIRAAAELEL